MKYRSSPEKKLIIKIKGEKYARYLIKTHFIETSDKLEKIIEKYALSLANDKAKKTSKEDLIIEGEAIEVKEKTNDQT